MEFDEVIARRHSVRSYSPRLPSDIDLKKILEAAHCAPSAGGLNSRRFFLVKDISLKKQLAAAALDQEFIIKAPVVLIVCADLNMISSYGDRGRNLYCIQDTAAAIENALLKIVDLGLGACWVGAFDEDQVIKICRLPKELRPVALITIGYEK